MIIVDEKYGEAMMKRQEHVVPELQVRLQVAEATPDKEAARLAMALRLALRRHKEG